METPKTTLSDRERKVLLTLYDKGFEALSSDTNTALSSLERKGLVKCAWVEASKKHGRMAEDAYVTDEGKELILSNPTLKNPVDWKWVIATVLLAITAIGTVVAAVAALIACAKLT